MAQHNHNWDDLGRSIQDIIDKAVSSRDYQKLNQTIHQVVDRAVDMGSQTVRRAVDNASRTASVRNQGAKQPVEARKDLPVLYGSTNGKTAGGILKIVGGSLLAGVSFMLFFSSLVFDLLVAGASILALPAVLTLLGLTGGTVLIGNGIGNLNFVSRFKMYRKTLGQKTHCALEKLARSVGKSEKFVRRELRKMIDQGLFLEGHMDREQTCLITSDETYRYFEQSRLALEERQRQAAEQVQKKAHNAVDPRVQEVLDRGNAFVAQIRKCNDDIPGVEISEKISRMEMIVQRIFDRAETNPEVIPDLKKLMDYYLPMTVKLLNAYADMDAQPVQGETILASKREIESTLDTLNQAYEKLLDELFQDTALDVSSDISVLNTLLAQEGLTEDAFSKIRKQN
ncbi:MAG: 5-bromo-4-chloroindolyl phosphate hydrolysis family protein [Oscillospiraceae bacterium]|nr:5-bromo-4-chloroindolyl phosphate hydrolysis family protein [Oscillospiraceae bacterium]